MICQRGRLTIGREAFGLAVEAPAGRQGPRLGSGLVVGLAAEAEQSVQQALRLGRRAVVGGPRIAIARLGAAEHVGDGVTDDPHAHPLGPLDLGDRKSVVEGRAVPSVWISVGPDTLKKTQN